MSPGAEKTTPPAEANPGGREAESRPTISSESTSTATEMQHGCIGPEPLADVLRRVLGRIAGREVAS